MSGEVQRVQPFDAENAALGPKPSRRVHPGDLTQLQLEALSQFFGGLDHSCCASNRPDVFQNPTKIATSKRNNLRRRGHRIRKPVNLTVSDRADFAQVLGED
jgi:hypothetical protein